MLAGALNLIPDSLCWSGGVQARRSAEQWAKLSNSNAVTLEQTMRGFILDRITTPKNFKYFAESWSSISKTFAQGAKGDVHVFHSASNGVRLESVWATKEYPILKANGNNIIYH